MQHVVESRVGMVMGWHTGRALIAAAVQPLRMFDVRQPEERPSDGAQVLQPLESWLGALPAAQKGSEDATGHLVSAGLT